MYDFFFFKFLLNFDPDTALTCGQTLLEALYVNSRHSGRSFLGLPFYR